MYNAHTMYMYIYDTPCDNKSNHNPTSWFENWFSVYNIKVSDNSRKCTTNAGYCVKDL